MSTALEDSDAGDCGDLRSIVRSIAHLAERYAAERQAAAADAGLTAQMADMAIHLLHRGRSRMTDLSRALACDTGNCSGVIDRLEERGLVTREPHPTDRRVRMASLTPAGRRLATKLSKRLDASPFLSALRTLDAGDRAALRRGLRALDPESRAAPVSG